MEYQRAFEANQIDWDQVLGRRCAICGQVGCYREISPYVRGVIELFPWRMGWVTIQRFQCRVKETTFSLLPAQLVPYHRYTLESIVGVLLLVWQARDEDNKGIEAAIDELVGDSDLGPYLVAYWLGTILRGLRQAHPQLTSHYDLSMISSATTPTGYVDEVYAYCKAFQARAPPTRHCLDAPCARYASMAHLFLVGCPSQHRPRMRR